jgi:hypothetical protein
MIMGRGRQIAQRAITCGVGPRLEALQFGKELVEKPFLLSQGKLKSAFAEVIAAAFGQNSREAVGQALSQKGYILIDQLLLEGDCIGADQDPALPSSSKLYGRDKISEALTDAGAGLDSQMRAFAQGVLGCRGHLDLLRAGLETGQKSRKKTSGGKSGFDIKSRIGSNHLIAKTEVGRLAVCPLQYYEKQASLTKQFYRPNCLWEPVRVVGGLFMGPVVLRAWFVPPVIQPAQPWSERGGRGGAGADYR